MFSHMLCLLCVYTVYVIIKYGVRSARTAGCHAKHVLLIFNDWSKYVYILIKNSTITVFPCK